MTHQDIIEALSQWADAERIPQLHRFFKTEAGGYGEGDEFIGVKVPDQRVVAKAYFKSISLTEVSILLRSPIHEHRHTALFILINKYCKAKTLTERKEIFDFYIDHMPHINNWDLVDSSTHKIVGPYLHETNHFEYLFTLAQHDNMWIKRIAIVSLWYLWKKGYHTQGLELIRQHLEHPHDLMHKANGWMLKELGKINEDAMLEFVFINYDQLPRTTLRYAIEKINEPLRTIILRKEF